MQWTPPATNSRKRRCSGQPSGNIEAGDHRDVSKKPKCDDIADPQLAISQNVPSATSLKREALRALNRENRQAARKSRSSQRPRRPNTRSAQAEWERRHQTTQLSDQYLEACGHEQHRALKYFARHGGPDLRDLRGCQKAAVYKSNPMEPGSTSRTPFTGRSSRTKDTTISGTNKSISPYNQAFEQTLIDSCVYPPDRRPLDSTASPKPENWNYIRERLARRRRSLSPSKFTELQHRLFVEADLNVTNENDVKTKVFPSIQGAARDDASGEVLFSNLDALITSRTITSGKPDIYHGGRTGQVDLPVLNDLNHLIVPSTNLSRPVAPNHFTALKGPNGSLAVAVRQATYDMFLGARGIDALRTYKQAVPYFDNKAYTFACIYQSTTGLLVLFAGHPVQPDNHGQQTPYYMNRVKSFNMKDDTDAWREGATWYRNSIDLAKEWRDEWIRTANEANRTYVAPAIPAPAIPAPAIPDPSNSLALMGSQPDLGALTMGSQPNNTASSSDEEFETAESSQGEEEQEKEEEEEEEEEEEGEGEEEEEEEEEQEVASSLAEQSSELRRQTDPGKKRQNREDSADVEEASSPSRIGASQSSSTVKRQKAKGKGKEAV